jgi:desulfoferrodoxin (superoxide reductase-like protein)
MSATGVCSEIVAVDKHPPDEEFVELSSDVQWVTADLNTSEREAVLEFGDTFDVSVTFETIEHLIEPQEFVSWLCQITTRTIVASVPVVPSTHFNHFHLHDFTEHDLPAMFASCGWGLTASFDQPAESSKVYVFGLF